MEHDTPSPSELPAKRVEELSKLVQGLSPVEFKLLKRTLAVNHHGIDLRKAAPKQ